ncbi:16S rRNA (guanine(966)-N(2))-methyltransferase RsmD [Rhodopila globiformis]|uniref:16S rRNA (Guanine(966)-N(2))-methyltransferase RsmD n=1 Tax=Rhodopila globiformis TaxID=1071 RepID=A0A2S6NI89_RHOGL|nr:16S rRNA (guanine(966)-N(2))-methyltransferase RsmD [Rhodopila globiformis]PPQ34367.1 16S rRNA (guanine(966)-N(2))-methyltransferase RsmD [Rhodopila globiformis]
MRIVGGAWRGRGLAAPPGLGTRPTADRVRQAVFDMLLHAPWGGRDVVEGASVLDVFAGTGAMGLEALSRGAAFASFIESDPAALKVLRANVAACRAEARVEIVAGDVFRVGQGRPASLVFLDPPYGQDLVPRAIARLRDVGRIAPEALVVAETGRDETWVPDAPLLAERRHGAARMLIFRLS